MCGICGFAGRGSADDLARMNSTLVHRGPDDSGTWNSTIPSVHLASRRLSIVDLPSGHQPMTSSDGQLTIVFNGEIYNHRQLRTELEEAGHKFETDHSDTEVLLYGYREWGPKLLQRLNGMWAFAIYDLPRALIFCSRDRFGKKPFYYAGARDAFVFASEVTAVAQHPSIRKTISRRALQKYFAYGYIPSPLSIYQGVLKLPAGCSLSVDVRSFECRLERYWDLLLDPFQTIPRHPEEEWGERLRELLDRAVKSRLVADVAVGVFLGGGIDSSAITAFASRHVDTGKLKTFSIGFTEQSFDETEFARRIGATFKTDHNEETLSVNRAREVTDDCLSRLDEPMGDSSILPTYLLSGFARQAVKVALGGDGGDELFAGYDPFLALRRAKFYRTIFPRPVHQGIKALFDRLPVSHANMALDFKIKRALRGLDYDARFWLPIWMAPVEFGGLEELFSQPLDIEDIYSEAIELWDRCPQDDLVGKTLQFYTKLYLQNDILTKVDRASMMHSLEVRTPFLDIELVDFARRIPSNYKFRHGTTKYILKKALENVLPRKIVYRAKKGFGVPIGAWFKNHSFPIESARFGDLNPRLIERKLADHRAGKSDERSLLWCFYVLSKWWKASQTSS